MRRLAASASKQAACNTPATGARPHAKGRAQLAALATPSASFSPNAAKHRTRSMHLGGERCKQRARDCSPASQIPRTPALALSLNLRPPSRCPATRLLNHCTVSAPGRVAQFAFAFFWWIPCGFRTIGQTKIRSGQRPGLRHWSKRDRAHRDMATAPRRAPQRRRGSVSAEVMAPPAPGLTSFAAENKGFGCGPIRCSGASVKATMPPDEQRCARSAHT